MKSHVKKFLFLSLLLLLSKSQSGFSQGTENCFACRFGCESSYSFCIGRIDYYYYRAINECYTHFNQQWYCCITNWIGSCCDAWMHPLDVWEDCMDDAYWEREMATFSCRDEYYRCQSACDSLCDTPFEDNGGDGTPP